MPKDTKKTRRGRMKKTNGIRKTMAKRMNVIRKGQTSARPNSINSPPAPLDSQASIGTAVMKDSQDRKDDSSPSNFADTDEEPEVPEDLIEVAEQLERQLAKETFEEGHIVNIKAYIADLRGGVEPGKIYQGGLRYNNEKDLDQSPGAPRIFYAGEEYEEEEF
ncbi:hypothetical protein TWF696_003917 [Orbilia brochopaga]|uniref:Uncharacterized protein n=1 Tax=Orbilia brochopaga TaxID=3140254 RepID=A0AAV9VB24_9PEZI